jgi:hypothetical protein|tara:strand:- start:1221 stop:1958 length:738 start_codon:yes stop_codon:yes gene_type:complete
MANFSTFQTIMPDPTTAIATTGSAEGSIYGPGFASVKLRSDAPVMQDRTNSGRLITRAVAGHKWDINITYNPMTRSQFEPISNFLLQQRGGLIPFFVSLPQNKLSQNAAFAALSATTGNTVAAVNSYTAGTSSILITATGISNTVHPEPGDLFSVLDSADYNHQKIYKVTRVETPADYYTTTGAPGSAQVRIHFVPGLQKNLAGTAIVDFSNPLFRVVLGSSVQEYSLGTNNLYSFSLKLEEAQP